MVSRIFLFFIALSGVGFGQTLTNTTHIPSGTVLPASCNQGTDFFAMNTNTLSPGLYVCGNSNSWKFLPGVPVGASFPSSSCLLNTAFIRTDQSGPNFYVCDPATRKFLPPSDATSYNFTITQNVVTSISVNGGPALIGDISLNTAQAPAAGMVKSNGTVLQHAVAGTDYLAPGSVVTTVNGQTGDVTVSSGLTAPSAGMVKSNGTTLITASAGIDYAIPGEIPVIPSSAGMVKSDGTALQHAVAGTDYVLPSAVPTIPSTVGVVKSNGTALVAAVAGTDYAIVSEIPTIPSSAGMVKSDGTALVSAVAGTDFVAPGSVVTTVNGQTGDVTISSGLTAPATGMVKSDGTVLQHAVAGTDYVLPSAVPTIPGSVGIVKSNGTALVSAVAGTDFLTPSGTNTLTGANDFSGASLTKPVRTFSSLPGTCSVGEFGYLTTATAGQNIELCTATNTWTAVTTTPSADFSAFSLTKPARTFSSLPGTCSTGEFGYLTTASAGQNIELCTATNTWTQVTGSLPSFVANQYLTNNGSSSSWGDILTGPTGALCAGTNCGGGTPGIVDIVPSVVATKLSGTNSFVNANDFSGASLTKPARTFSSLPGTCSTGEFGYLTTATAGQNIELCTATNTWTQVSSGGGGLIFEASSHSSTVLTTACTAINTDFTFTGITIPANTLSVGNNVKFTYTLYFSGGTNLSAANVGAQVTFGAAGTSGAYNYFTNNDGSQLMVEDNWYVATSSSELQALTQFSPGGAQLYNIGPNGSGTGVDGSDAITGAITISPGLHCGPVLTSLAGTVTARYQVEVWQ